MADGTLRALHLLHGVNLDMLGRRDPEHYGAVTLAELEKLVRAHARSLGFETHAFQTNHEGEMVERLHEIAVAGADALLINAGAWTHYSYAIRDALEMIAAPIAEVHLSPIGEREEWRRHSVIADIATVQVSGKGPQGYIEALDALAAKLDASAGRQTP
jgi:3-dehydroquinate dehydratase II